MDILDDMPNKYPI